MKFFALLLGLLISSPLCAIEMVGNTIVLSDDDVNECREHGGCAWITRDQLEEIVHRHVQDALVRCANHV